MRGRMSKDRLLPVLAAVHGSAAARRSHLVDQDPSIAPDRAHHGHGFPQPPRRGAGHRAPDRARHGPGEGHQR